MARLFKPRRHKKGLAPGTPRYVGDTNLSPTIKVSITLIQKDLPLEVFESNDVSEIFKHQMSPEKKLWISIEGLPSEKDILRIGEHFHISKLILEDVLNTDHRPKGEELDEHIFIILKGPERHPPILPGGEPGFRFEQLSSFVGENFVLTIQEKLGDYFETIHKRLAENPKRFLELGEDYLFYTQIDYVLDEYFEALTNLGERADLLDQHMRGEFVSDDLIKIQDLRKDFLLMRRSLFPIKEFLQKIVKGEIRGIDNRIRDYLLDAIEHGDHLIDIIDSYREVLSGLVEVHLGRITHRSNEIMKVMTLYASIFIPLTFIVGIYGMNFDNMPEYHWRYGYLFVWGILIFVTAASLYYFRRKRWL
jgi:magnesium transporter